MSRALRVFSLLAPADLGYRRQVEKLEPELILFPQQDIFPRKIRGTKKAVIFYDLIHWVYRDYFAWPRRLLQIALERSTLREADHIIVISKQTKQELIRFYGVDPAKMYVLYPTLPHMPRPFVDDPVGTDYILYPANSWPHKRHKFLIEAIREINARSPNTPITLVLTGYVYRDSRWILDMCDGIHIRHLGYVSRPVLHSLYAHCRFVVFPSQYEGFGIPILEAMTFGKRVLASDIPILKEIAGDSIHYFQTQEQLKGEVVRLWSEKEPSELRTHYAPYLARFQPEKICFAFRRYLDAL
jgi:glycosyltransferase involved in cell wall biosynthesis